MPLAMSLLYPCCAYHVNSPARGRILGTATYYHLFTSHFPCFIASHTLASGVRPASGICAARPRVPRQSLSDAIIVWRGGQGKKKTGGPRLLCLCEFRGKVRFPPRSAMCGSGKRSKAEFADGFDGMRITIGKRALAAATRLPGYFHRHASSCVKRCS